MTLMGIFGGIILPFGKKIINRAHLVADKTRLSYLVAQYDLAVNSGNSDLTNAGNVIDFAVILAKAGGPNDVSAYQSEKRKNKQPKKILVDGKVNPVLKEEDFDFIAVCPKYSIPSGTPLFYTRGLQSDGTWGKDSLYGTAGGLVVFKDGYVEWFHQIDKDSLRCIRYRKGGNSPLFLPVDISEETIPPQRACHRKLHEHAF